MAKVKKHKPRIFVRGIAETNGRFRSNWLGTQMGKAKGLSRRRRSTFDKPSRPGIFERQALRLRARALKKIR